ncbi:hypothetical protein Hanom_Chr08g00754911 [Helianthus anomalus]
MPSSYPGRHMSLPRLEPSTSGKRWVSVANWGSWLLTINIRPCVVVNTSSLGVLHHVAAQLAMSHYGTFSKICVVGM